MYDTIKVWQRIDNLKGSGYLQRVPTLLTNVSLHQKSNGTEYITGSLENLNIAVSEVGLSINGSLNKFWHKDNFNKLTRQEAFHTIELLEDTLHLPLKNADVKRFDIAHNFLMNSPVKDYYNLLGESQRYKRLMQENSVYYNNSQRQKLFYDKVSEGKFRGLEVPEIWQKRNVLRYELRFTGRLTKQFNRSQVLVSDLFDEKFYIDAIDYWSKEYFEIKKNRLLSPKKNNMTSKDAKDYLLGALIEKIGFNEISELTEFWKSNFSTPKEAQRFKASLKNLKSLNEESPLIAELDKKILRTKEYYR